MDAINDVSAAETISKSRRYDKEECPLFLEEEIYLAYGKNYSLIRGQLELLLKGLESKKLYMPSDRQFQLMDRAIRSYCDIYNDSFSDWVDDPDCKNLVYYRGKKPVTELDCEEMFDEFFWDRDYDLPPAVASRLSTGDFDMSGSAINASLHTLVDTEDLTLVEYGDET